MKEIVEEAKRNTELHKKIESLLELLNVPVSENASVNHALLLYLSNIYYKTLCRVQDIYKNSEKQIEALYKYNKIKDAAQDILGKLAEIKGVTIKKISEEYDTPE